MIKGLFIVGNKRCGTSLLVKLLNEHPEIFISFESDIIWFLHQQHHPYRFDSPFGLNRTIEITKGLKLSLNTYDNFLTIQEQLFKNQNTLKNKQFKELKYIGDKKPNQNSEPEILAFIKSFLPNSKFIHLTRSLHCSVMSGLKNEFPNTNEELEREYKNFNKERWKKYKYRQDYYDYLYKKRLLFEQKAMAIEENIIRITYETLCKHRDDTMKSIYKFLGLSYIKSNIPINKNENDKWAILIKN